MPRKGFTSEQIIRLLKEAEILIGEGSTTKEAVRRIGVSEQTFYKWRREYGGLRVDQARRLKDLEKENARLKRRLTGGHVGHAEVFHSSGQHKDTVGNLGMGKPSW